MGRPRIKQIDDTQTITSTPQQEVHPPTPTIKKSTIKKPITAKKKLRGKRYQAKLKLVDRSKAYPLAEAVELVKKTAYTSFPSSLDLHINTSSKNLRGLVTLPYLSGKTLRILAFGKGAAESGADIIGSEETIADIEKGKIDFDVVVATPEWMPKLAKVAKILGPRGLMPNPKSGTITEDLAKTVAELKAGKIEYKTEPNGMVIHLPVGRIDQPTEEIISNIKTLFINIGKSKIKKMVLAPTMGIGVKIDLNSI